jgi:hypothetical protein
LSLRKGLARITLELVKARAVQPALAVTYLLASVVFVVLESVAASDLSVYLCRIVAWAMVALGLGAAVHDLLQRIRHSSGPEQRASGPVNSSLPQKESTGLD